MPIYKFLTTRVGSYTVDTLDTKAKPVHIPPRSATEESNTRLHQWVLEWVSNNLDDTAQQLFYGYLRDNRYGAAHQVLTNAFFSNGRVTIWDRKRFDKWVATFDKVS